MLTDTRLLSGTVSSAPPTPSSLSSGSCLETAPELLMAINRSCCPWILATGQLSSLGLPSLFSTVTSLVNSTRELSPSPLSFHSPETSLDSSTSGSTLTPLQPGATGTSGSSGHSSSPTTLVKCSSNSSSSHKSSTTLTAPHWPLHEHLTISKAQAWLNNYLHNHAACNFERSIAHTKNSLW